MGRRIGQAGRSLGRGETKMNQNKTGSKDTKDQEDLFITRISTPHASVCGRHGRILIREALVGTERLYVTILQGGPPRGW